MHNLEQEEVRTLQEARDFAENLHIETDDSYLILILGVAMEEGLSL